MKLLSIKLARSIWLGPVVDFNPRGNRVDHILFPYLIDTYKFKQFPSLSDPIDLTKGMVFNGGTYKVQDNRDINISLTIYSDGVVVDTASSTNDADMFLEKLIGDFCEVFSQDTFKSILKEKLYVSQVYVSCEKNIGLLNPKLSKITDYLSQNVENGIEYFLGGISFWADQTHKRIPGPFLFERAANTPFSENRYYSSAPLQTEKHLEVIDKIEEILA